MAIRYIKSVCPITIIHADRFPELGLLCFSLFEKLDMAQRIHGDDSPDGADAVRCVANFLVRVQDEVCRVKDFPALFPERAHFVRVPRHFETVSHGECKLQLVNGFFGLVERIDR